jgi:hypothetical protein
MREQVLAAFARGDEAEALGVVEPLNGTGCHLLTSIYESRDESGRDEAGRWDIKWERTATTSAAIAATGEWTAQIRCLKHILRRGS